MHAYYSARAREYDTVYQKPERQPDLREIEAWLPAALKGRSVIEVACGTGYWTQFYAPAADRVLAFDAADETLQIARTRLSDDKVMLVRGDAYDIPAGDRTFDAAFAGFWWSHIPLDRIDAFLQGLHRVLKPGARVMVLDNRFVAGSSTPVSQPDAQGNTYQTRTLSDGSTHRVLKNFPSREALLAAVGPYAQTVEHRHWPYFWALVYSLKG